MFSGNNVPETNLAPAILYCLVAKKCEEYFPIIVWPYCILLRSRNFFTKHVIRLKIREGFGVFRFQTIKLLLNSFLFFEIKFLFSLVPRIEICSKFLWRQKFQKVAIVYICAQNNFWQRNKTNIWKNMPWFQKSVAGQNSAMGVPWAHL